MIEYIELINFQKHQNKRIDFKDGIIFLNGENNAGKSCIIRALQWVSLNKGNSKQYRRTFEKNGVIHTTEETRVKVGVDGHTVERVVSASKNEYWLDGVKYTGFGRVVPSDIDRIFNMTELNVSNQFAPLFLIGDSGSTIAEEISKVIHLEEMSLLSDQVNKDIRLLSDIVSVKVSELDWLNRDKDIIEKYIDQVDQTYNDIIKCEEVIADNELELYNFLDVYEPLSKSKDLTPIQDQIGYINSFSCESLESEINAVRELEDLYTHIKEQIPIPDFDEFDEFDTIQNLKTEIQIMVDILSNFDRLSNELDVCQKEYNKLSNTLSEFKQCPMCGNKIGD